MIKLYGIKNCDTVKQARQWLDKHAIAHSFHDFRHDGLTPQQLEYILSRCPWETLLNKRSTTWRTLNISQAISLNEATAKNLLLEHPTLIKRPILEMGDKMVVGFSAANYQAFILAT